MEAHGGLPAALASGAFQRGVAENAVALRREVARLKAPITGVSAHADLGEGPVDLSPSAPSPRPPAVEPGALAPIRLSAPFEALRDRSDGLLKKNGVRPKVYLVALGPESSHRRRVAFMREWLEAGGFETVYDGETRSPEDAARRLKASAATLACLCGDDETYAAEGEAFASAIRTAGVRALSLAGRPGEAEAKLRSAGVDDFIFAGGDAILLLEGLYRRIAA